jgi:hypothetical protein
MYALIPCPEGILKDIKENLQGSEHFEGFWLVSQDPSLIAQAGTNAVCSASKGGLSDVVDRKFGLPYGYSRLRACEPRIWKWSQRGGYGYGEDATTISAKRAFVDKCEKKNDDYWLIYGLLPTPQVVDPKLHELDVLVEARRHVKGVYTNHFKLQGDHKVEVVKDDFIVEDTPLGSRIIFNPKRAKRLITVRRRHHSVGQRKPKHTCYRLILDIICTLRDLITSDHFTHLFYERWSSQGINNCSDAVVSFFEIAKQMGKLKTARKKLAPTLRELYVHKNLIQHNCSASFRIWYAKELELAGGPPKNAERYITRVKSEAIQENPTKV